MRDAISRRSFLQASALSTVRTSMAGAVGAFIGTAAGSDEPAVIGPDPSPVTLHVNGAARTIQVEPRMTLAEALRGPLGLTGTKIGCNRGACSACTVWLDGVPALACMTLAIDIGARAVTTIEGLARGATLHPVQQAFIKHDAMQCGFCTPGLAMSCAALVEDRPDLTAEEVKMAIGGHFCRCGTYPHVIAATLDAAKTQKG